MMDENPYEAPQTGDHPPKPKAPPDDRWPYLNAMLACLLSGIMLSVLAHMLIAPELKTASLTNAVGVCVWVTAVLIGLWEYRRFAKRGRR